MEFFGEDESDWRAADRGDVDDSEELSQGDELERLRALRGVLALDCVINAHGDAHVGTPATDSEAFMQRARQQQLARLLEVEHVRPRGGSNASLSNTETTRSIASTTAHDTRAHSPQHPATPTTAPSCAAWEVHVAPRLAPALDHHVYRIALVRPGDGEHVACGRYSELRRVHDGMLEAHPAADVPFPRKKLLGNRGDVFVQERAADLRTYFAHVCRVPALAQFWLQQPLFRAPRHESGP